MKWNAIMSFQSSTPTQASIFPSSSVAPRIPVWRVLWLTHRLHFPLMRCTWSGFPCLLISQISNSEWCGCVLTWGLFVEMNIGQCMPCCPHTQVLALRVGTQPVAIACVAKWLPFHTKKVIDTLFISSMVERDTISLFLDARVTAALFNTAAYLEVLLLQSCEAFWFFVLLWGLPTGELLNDALSGAILGYMMRLILAPIVGANAHNAIALRGILGFRKNQQPFSLQQVLLIYAWWELLHQSLYGLVRSKKDTNPLSPVADALEMKCTSVSKQKSGSTGPFLNVGWECLTHFAFTQVSNPSAFACEKSAGLGPEDPNQPLLAILTNDTKPRGTSFRCQHNACETPWFLWAASALWDTLWGLWAPCWSSKRRLAVGEAVQITSLFLVQ